MDQDQAKLIGLPNKGNDYNIKNFKERYNSIIDVKKVLKAIKLVVVGRRNVLIKGGKGASRSHLGVGILKAMLKTDSYLNVNGDVVPERVRYIRADKFVTALNNSVTSERKLMWDNLLIAFDDGSGLVKTIMIDSLGTEFGRDAENHMKLIIRNCEAEGVQLIATTSLTLDALEERYGEEVSCLLLEGNIINLRERTK